MIPPLFPGVFWAFLGYTFAGIKNEREKLCRLEYRNQTWTFTDKPNEATTITLIDSEGTTVIFEVDNDGDGAQFTAYAIYVEWSSLTAAGAINVLFREEY